MNYQTRYRTTTIFLFLIFITPHLSFSQTWKLDSLVSTKGYKYTFEYKGALLDKETYNGNTIEYVYDSDNKFIGKNRIWSNGNSSPIACTFDPCGNFVRAAGDSYIYYHEDCDLNEYSFDYWEEYMVDLSSNTPIKDIWKLNNNIPQEHHYFSDGCFCCDPVSPDYTVKYQLAGTRREGRETCGTLQHHRYIRNIYPTVLSYTKKKYDDVGEYLSSTSGIIEIYKNDNVDNVLEIIRQSDTTTTTLYTYDVNVFRSDIVMPEVIQRRDYIDGFWIDQYTRMRTSKIDFTSTIPDTITYHYSEIELISSTKQEALTGFDDFHIFPNPVSDFIQIDINEEIGTRNLSALVFDNSGNQILTQTLKDGNLINISNLNSGIYFIQLQDNDEFISTSKFIKL